MADETPTETRCMRHKGGVTCPSEGPHHPDCMWHGIEPHAAATEADTLRAIEALDRLVRMARFHGTERGEIVADLRTTIRAALTPPSAAPTPTDTP